MVRRNRYRARVYEYIQLSVHVRAHDCGKLADDVHVYGRCVGLGWDERIELHVAAAQREHFGAYCDSAGLCVLEGQPLNW